MLFNPGQNFIGHWGARIMPFGQRVKFNFAFAHRLGSAARNDQSHNACNPRLIDWLRGSYMFNILRRTILQDFHVLNLAVLSLETDVSQDVIDYHTPNGFANNKADEYCILSASFAHGRGLVHAESQVVQLPHRDAQAGLVAGGAVRDVYSLGAGQSHGTGNQLVARQFQHQLPEQRPDSRRRFTTTFTRDFNPTNFNADRMGPHRPKRRHEIHGAHRQTCDGFLLWDSKVDAYNISRHAFPSRRLRGTGKGRAQQGMQIGWYFSPMDWRDPDCRTANNDRFVQKMQAELRELLSNYGQIDVLWFDSDGRPAMWDPTNTYALVRKLQPQILINNRLDMSTHEQWVHQEHLNPNEDFYTPEQRIGAYDDKTPWETCMTLGTQWSWKPDDKIKSAGEVIRILAQCAGGDGNLLLDVGPMPDGRIEPRQVAVLKQVGAWLDKNGESIYGTRGGPWKPTKAIASTRKGNVIYVHVLHDASDIIELPAIARKIKSASLLNGSKVKFKSQDGTLVLTVPTVERDPAIPSSN